MCVGPSEERTFMRICVWKEHLGLRSIVNDTSWCWRIGLDYNRTWRDEHLRQFSWVNHSHGWGVSFLMAWNLEQLPMEEIQCGKILGQVYLCSSKKWGQMCWSSEVNLPNNLEKLTFQGVRPWKHAGKKVSHGHYITNFGGNKCKCMMMFEGFPFLHCIVWVGFSPDPCKGDFLWTWMIIGAPCALLKSDRIICSSWVCFGRC